MLLKILHQVTSSSLTNECMCIHNIYVVWGGGTWDYNRMYKQLLHNFTIQCLTIQNTIQWRPRGFPLATLQVSSCELSRSPFAILKDHNSENQTRTFHATWLTPSTLYIHRYIYSMLHGVWGMTFGLIEGDAFCTHTVLLATIYHEHNAK
jgi:hypothetical protein